MVYLADQDTDDVFELYSAPLSGGSAPVRLNGALVAGGDVLASATTTLVPFEISPDGRHVVYLADQQTDNLVELYAVPIEGGVPVRLNGPLAAGVDVLPPLRISADGARVVYLAGLESDGTQDLYSSLLDPLVGQGPVQLNTTRGVAWNFDISPDGSRVVYRGSRAKKLFSVPIDGSADPIVLNGNLVYGGQVGPFFAISADGSRVVYLADQETDEVVELFAAPIDRSQESIKLNGPLPPGGDVRSLYGELPFRISADGAHVAYLANQGSSSTIDLYGVSIGGGPTTRLNPLLARYGNVLSPFLLSSDNERVVYRAEGTTRNVVELYSVRFDGTGSAKLNPMLASAPDGDVLEFQLSPDGGRVVYLADLEKDIYQLYSTSLRSRSSPIELEGDQPGDSYYDFRVTPDGSRLVYLVWEEEGNELYSLPLDGGARPIELSTPLRVLTGFEVSPAGLVVYRAVRDSAGVVELYSVPADGSRKPVNLNGRLAPGGNVHSFRLGPSGGAVTYWADQEGVGTPQLYLVPADGSSAPRKLLDRTPRFEIGPDERRLVYLLDLDTPGVTELYSVPLDGSSGPVKLDGPLVPGGRVSWFSISPDSSRVVYATWQETAGLGELYAVPIAGGTPVILAAHEPWQPFGRILVSPDSVRVVYSHYSYPGHGALFSVPIDGGASPVRLNASLVPGGQIFEFEIGPDGRRVVYRADQEVDETYELYSVPVDGSSGPVKLNGPLRPNGDVGARLEYGSYGGFQISPDGSLVVYHADQELDSVHDLYAVPIEGGASPHKVNGPSSTGMGVWFDHYDTTFQITADSRRVVYLANQDDASVTELYASLLTAGPGRER